MQPLLDDDRDRINSKIAPESASKSAATSGSLESSISPPNCSPPQAVPGAVADRWESGQSQALRNVMAASLLSLYSVPLLHKLQHPTPPHQ
ncbi:hypothetical protein [Prochlorothrix hollandica]|uniref:hypothetical protein n=1 Tax=Prochlorothrix hollandica TaxID=1223 RepID=UPI0003471A32|nr:hypothetical protein [Prochlorothrix hollandica]